MTLAYAAALALTGCSSTNSCEAYINGLQACYDEAGVDSSAYDAETICGEWTAQAETTYGAWYQCMGDAYAGGDCSTSDGVTAASTDAAACTQ